MLQLYQSMEILSTDKLLMPSQSRLMISVAHRFSNKAFLGKPNNRNNLENVPTLELTITNLLVTILMDESI